MTAIEKVYQLEDELKKALALLKQCQNPKRTEQDLIDLHNCLRYLPAIVDDVEEIADNLVKNKFNLYLLSSTKDAEYYREVYKDNQVLLCMYLFVEVPRLLFLCREGDFESLSSKEIFDRRQSLDRKLTILSLDELKLAIKEEWEDWKQLKLWFQQSPYKILYLAPSFKEEYSTYFKQYFEVQNGC